jgi:predicted O-methyltransferase YrrM
MKKILFLKRCKAPLKVFFIYFLTKFKNFFLRRKIIYFKRKHQNFIKNKKITNDYFSSHSFNFFNILKKKKSFFEYLEIGSFEGNSAIFVAKNFPMSKVTCVDPWIKTSEYAEELNFIDVEKNYDENTKEFENIKKYRMTSDTFFKLNSNMFDVIYVDGYHYGPQVLKDLRNSWKFLYTKGYLICDDYIWNLSEKTEITPCFVINKFLREIKNEFIIKKVSNSQIFIKKIN